MAIRVIRTEEDPVLRKISKPVKEVTPKIVTLIDDMLDTCMRQWVSDLQHHRSVF